MHDGVVSLEEPTIGEAAAKRLAVLAVCKCGRTKELCPGIICISPNTLVSDVGAKLTCRQCGRRGLYTRVTLPRSEFRSA